LRLMELLETRIQQLWIMLRFTLIHDDSLRSIPINGALHSQQEEAWAIAPR
jgi:hypothetical protein